VVNGAVRESHEVPRAWDSSSNLIVVEELVQGSAITRDGPTQFVIGCRGDRSKHPKKSTTTGEEHLSRTIVDDWIETSDSLRDWKGVLDELWLERLVPFESNVRIGRRALRSQFPEIVEPDASWADEGTRLISRLEGVAGQWIRRIDHVGSTSVPGLPAKDLVDLQVVVDGQLQARSVVEHAAQAGFVGVTGNWFGDSATGMEFPEEVVVDADPGRPVNVNIRDVSMPVWRSTLLFRDFLRSHDDERDAYARLKFELAEREGEDVDSYGKDKMPWIFAALDRADGWCKKVGWKP
jgi:dephospho-CoA kinase